MPTYSRAKGAFSDWLNSSFSLACRLQRAVGSRYVDWRGRRSDLIQERMRLGSRSRKPVLCCCFPLCPEIGKSSTEGKIEKAKEDR